MEWYTEAYFIWFCIGLFFLLLEIGVPGLIVVFFGIGGWVTSAITWAIDPSINTQIIIFLIVSLLTLGLFRGQLKRRFFTDGQNASTLEEEFIGKEVTVLEDFTDGHGKVEFKGAQWAALSDDELKKGQQAVITDKESIKLMVKSK